jgi:undecaprenyl-diphosphatase
MRLRPEPRLRRSRSRSRQLTLGHALALGAIHGPAELLPISSSAHIALVPRLLGWPYAKLEPDLRKSFEVALHAGTAVGLLLALPGETLGLARSRPVLLALASLPGALAGWRWEHAIETRASSPLATVGGLAGGALALLAADRRPQVRAAADAGVIDALAIGLAQACALVPGVSRSGAALTAARARGFGRAASASLSRGSALPLLAGATALKAWRLTRTGLPRDLAAPFAAGALAAFASTIAAAPAVRRIQSDRSVAPLALYRLALAALAASRRVS